MLLGGILALAANPSRLTNRLFFVFATFAALAFACNAAAVYEGQQFYNGNDGDPKPWLRLSATFNHFTILMLVGIRASIVSTHISATRLTKESWGWLLSCGLVVTITWTNAYFPADSDPLNRERGWGYVLIIFWGIISLFVLVFQTYRLYKKSQGIKRVELSILVGNCALATAAYFGLNLLGNATEQYIFKVIAVTALPISFVSAGWLICHHHVFDLKEISAIVLRWSTTVLLCTVAGLSTFGILSNSSNLDAFPFTIAVLGLLFWPSHAISKRLIEGRAAIYSQTLTGHINALSSHTANASELADAFEDLLKSTSNSQLVSIFIKNSRNPRVQPPRQQLTHVMNKLRDSAWITPEALTRLSADELRSELRTWMIEQEIFLIISTTPNIESSGILLMFGEKRNRLPFTYPEVNRLTHLAQTIDTHLTRARLAEQSALQAKMEHLALMSRGLAHDLRNLLTPVSSFLVHTEGRFEPGSAAHEVHESALRSMHVMHDYVRDALAFSERLEIRPQELRPAEIFAAAITVVAPRAAARKVSLAIGSCADFVFTADPVLVQRLLVNLLANAVDASGEGKTVTLDASLLRPGWCTLEVRDEGCGIPPEHLQQIFEPYFSTKQLGDAVRGVGLGLTISDKIARLHGGSIRVHSVVNQGTTMSLDLPLQPPAQTEISPAVPSPHPA